ncbi:MAG: Nif11-like leader peptide family RiPP precursor [Eubacteriales bacterium]
MKLSKELLEKAQTAKSPEELLQMAKAENIELTAEEAAKAYAELHKTGELSDEELDNIAGGFCYESGDTPLFKSGDRVFWYDDSDKKRYGTIAKVFEKSEQFGNMFSYSIWPEGEGGVIVKAEKYLHSA